MPESQIDPAEFENLKQLGGDKFINELIDTFLEDAPRMISELNESQKAGDADAFRRAAHSLKSNGATFGATHLSELAKELEVLGRENKLGETGNRLEVLNEAYQQVAAELQELRP